MEQQLYSAYSSGLHNFPNSKKSVTDITESGKICVLDVEINGVKAIKKVSMSTVPRFMFIKPPSVEELVSI